MSEDETELKDLITDKLSDSGFLYDIKAQIRAAVLHLLSKENDVKFPVDKQKEILKDFVLKDEGVLALSLVKDMLEKLNLKNTLSVLELETQIIDCNLKSRSYIIDEEAVFNAYKDDNSPLLVQYLTKTTNNLNSNNSGNLEREIIRGTNKGLSNSNNSEPSKSKRILPQVQTTKDADSDDSIEFSDVIGLPGSSPRKDNDQNQNPYQVTQRTASSRSSNDKNEYSYEESFHSDKSSDTKQNDKSDPESIREVESEEISEKLDSTSDVTVDTGRDISFDYVETIK